MGWTGPGRRGLQPPPAVRALAGFYSFLDTEHVKLDEAGITAETARAFSPLEAIESGGAAIPPLFIARAGKDAIPGVNQSIDRFVEKALERNLTFTLVNHPAGSHGFEHRDDDVRTREILRMALAFFREHLTGQGEFPAPVRGAASLPTRPPNRPPEANPRR